MNEISKSRIHWNYFLALEDDLKEVSRFIEFSEENFSVYSIELAHLLFAASSEVEVVAKQLCKQVDPKSKPKDIDDLRIILMGSEFENIADTPIFAPRFGLKFNPWENWKSGNSPDWWKSYNKVKHERHQSFNKATLENSLNAIAALLVLTYKYYHSTLPNRNKEKCPMETMSKLEPQSSLLRLSENHYYGNVVLAGSDW